MEYLTFALAKGRLADITMDLLEKMGITCDEMKENSRKLIFTNEELKLKFSWLRHLMFLHMLNMVQQI